MHTFFKSTLLALSICTTLTPAYAVGNGRRRVASDASAVSEEETSLTKQDEKLYRALNAVNSLIGFGGAGGLGYLSFRIWKKFDFFKKEIKKAKAEGRDYIVYSQQVDKNGQKVEKRLSLSQAKKSNVIRGVGGVISSLFSFCFAVFGGTSTASAITGNSYFDDK